MKLARLCLFASCLLPHACRGHQPEGDTVYTGMGLINTLPVNIHDNIWITPAATGIVRINENGEQLFTVESSGILSNTVSCSSVDQSN